MSAQPVPVFSRNIIVGTIRNCDTQLAIDAWSPEEIADAIIKALAAEHIHMFKSEGSEL
jgi:hypothetical protein